MGRRKERRNDGTDFFEQIINSCPAVLFSRECRGVSETPIVKFGIGDRGEWNQTGDSDANSEVFLEI